MKTRTYVYLIIVVAIVVIIAASMNSNAPASTDTAALPQQNTAVKPAAQTVTTAKPAATTASAKAPAAPQYYKVSVVKSGLPIWYSTSTTQDMIKVSNPSLNTSVSSPFTIGGLARGPWLFDGFAPVILTDANGKVIAQGSIVAQGNWRTNEFVTFISTFTYPPQPSNSTGVLVIKNSNPSGLAEKDQSVEILVRFK